MLQLLKVFPFENARMRSSLVKEQKWIESICSFRTLLSNLVEHAMICCFHFFRSCDCDCDI